MATKTIEKSITDLKNLTSKINPEHKEGPIAKAIEKQTAKLPSDVFLWAGLGVMAGALTLKVLKKDHLALFIGQWASPFLLFGIYDKLVKLEGHDKTDKGVKASGRKQISNA
jgi:hypothetical protein